MRVGNEAGMGQEGDMIWDVMVTDVPDSRKYTYKCGYADASPR